VKRLFGNDYVAKQIHRFDNYIWTLRKIVPHSRGRLVLKLDADLKASSDGLLLPRPNITDVEAFSSRRPRMWRDIRIVVIPDGQ
jgi:hypothetical protein